MSVIPAVLLSLGLAWPGDIDQFFQTAAGDPARLREMLQDRQHSRNQSQAALLLVLNRSPEAEDVVRQGLRQDDSPEVFLMLAAALRLSRDGRFIDELLAALTSNHPPIRQAAADTLAVLADADMVPRLQALAEDARADPAARQAALQTLGCSGQKMAAGVLLEQLANQNEALRRAAVEALTNLTGQTYGTDTTRWRTWWERHKGLSNERWLEERLAYQVIRDRRLEGELERTRAQVVRLHQQLYARLPAADRLGHVQSLLDHEDPAVRVLAAVWSAELFGTSDAVGRQALTDLLLRLSRDGAIEVQRLAVLALGRVTDPRGFDQARGLLRRGQPPVRAAAAHALAQQALSQARASLPEVPGAEAPAADASLLRQVVPLLQKALDDPALEVVVAAAEDLGLLGVPEAGPVLAAMLRHPSDSVRQAVAVALERVADTKVLDSLLPALDDRAVTVRFSLVGAIGRAAGDGQALPEPQRARVIARLEELLLRDADPGVRSRAATVLGQCSPAAEVSFLYRRVLSREDSRVQDKAWAAMLEIIARSGNVDLLREWDRTLADTRQGTRRLQLLNEVCARWKKSESTRAVVGPALEILVQAQLTDGKWAAAFPLVRELLARPGTDAEVDRYLGCLLNVGELALQEGSRAEALQAVHEAQPFLARRNGLAAEFEKLEKNARK